MKKLLEKLTHEDKSEAKLEANGDENNEQLSNHSDRCIIIRNIFGEDLG